MSVKQDQAIEIWTYFWIDWGADNFATHAFEKFWSC